MTVKVILDLAVVGSWDFRAPHDHPRQGKAVRLSYACLGRGDATAEMGTLVLYPPDGLVVTRENEARGGITLEGLRTEGHKGTGLSRNAVWRHMEGAQQVITFCQDFHLKALRSFAGALGVDLDALPRPLFVDLMTVAAPLAKIEWPSGGQSRTGRDRYKNPSLQEAYDVIVGGDLTAKRLEALAQPKPVSAWGMVQVSAIAELYRAIKRPVAADRFAMG